MERILIIDSAHDLLIRGLRAMNWEVDYMPEVSPSKAATLIPGYSGLIMNSKVKISAQLLDMAPKLRFVARLGSGLDILDLSYARLKGIQVLNSPEGNCDAVAEHTIAMILSLFNKLQKADREVRTFTWKRDDNRGRELGGKTIGIIGFGNTGTSLATKLRNWNLSILAYDPYCLHYHEYPWVAKVGLEEIWNNADVISFHVQLTEETTYYFDSEFASKCKRGVVIINTSRGKVVNAEVLRDALLSGQVAGACLDVLEDEPPGKAGNINQLVYKDLFAMDQVVLSPHVAGRTHESFEKIASVMLEKIKKMELNN